MRKFYASPLTWKIKTPEKEIFLTFDDGPHPTITPLVLALLKKYNAKATFFCIGRNVERYPGIYRQIIEEGHAVGNHTYDHLNGWKTGNSIYLKNIILAGELIKSRLFRPPYGRIAKSQVKELAPVFKVIMWDVLSADFDVNVTPQRCLDNVLFNTRNGSIVVFHDSEKALPRLEFALPKALAHFAEHGYTMKAIV